MPRIDEAVLESNARLAAVAQAGLVLPAMAVRPDALARMAARLLDAPIAALTLVAATEEKLVGIFGMPEPFASTRRVALDHSVCAYVVSADHILAVPDMTVEEGMREHPLIDEYGVRSFAGVPLRDVDDRPVGSLTVVDTVPRAWTQEQLSVLVEIADLLGPLATRADIMPRDPVFTRRRDEQLRVCELQASTLLHEADTIEQVAEDVLRLIGDSLGWSYVSLWLVDNVGDCLLPAGSWSAPGLSLADVVPNRVLAGQGLPGTVWQTGQPVWLPDFAESEQMLNPMVRAFAATCTARGLRAALSVPVRAGEEVLGVLTCLSPAVEHEELLVTGLMNGIAAQLGHLVVRGRATALARELSRAREDFVSLVGHEMRTPLTSIATYAELLRDEPGVGVDLREMLDAINRNVTTMRVAVAELLQLAGLESGDLRVRTQPVDLVEVVNTAVTDAQNPAGVPLRTELPATCLVDADPVLLQQVADNLLSNAVKYSAGQQVCGEVLVSVHREGDVAVLAVADEGIGVPAAERELLFRRFYRASNVRHGGLAGTGLGLSLVRAIVEAHHGTVTIDPAHRHGTRVVVRLPTGRPA